MRIVFFGTSDVGLPTLEKLMQHHQVVGVVTTPDSAVGRKQALTPSPIAARAQELGLTVFKPEKVKGNSEVLSTFAKASADLWEELEELGADIYVVVSYGKILPKELIDAPPLKTLNIHFSLLPKYRGAAPIQAAIKNGETATGTTIFVLDELLDHGPVLAQVTEEIKPDDTFITLAQRLAEISAAKLIEILPSYQKGELVPQEQNHALATKAPMIKKEDGKIDWTKSAEEIYNSWRAYQPWPGIYTTLNGKLLKIIECKPMDTASIAHNPSPGPSPHEEKDFSSTPPLEEGQGEVIVKDVATSEVSMTPSNFPSRGGEQDPGTVLPSGIIACGSDTFLQITRLQPEGKQPMDIKSFLNGNKDFMGSALGQ